MIESSSSKYYLQCPLCDGDNWWQIVHGVLKMQAGEMGDIYPSLHSPPPPPSPYLKLDMFGYVAIFNHASMPAGYVISDQGAIGELPLPFPGERFANTILFFVVCNWALIYLHYLVNHLVNYMVLILLFFDVIISS